MYYVVPEFAVPVESLRLYFSLGRDVHVLIACFCLVFRPYEVPLVKGAESGIRISGFDKIQPVGHNVLANLQWEEEKEEMISLFLPVELVFEIGKPTIISFDV